MSEASKILPKKILNGLRQVETLIFKNQSRYMKKGYFSSKFLQNGEKQTNFFFNLPIWPYRGEGKVSVVIHYTGGETKMRKSLSGQFRGHFFFLEKNVFFENKRACWGRPPNPPTGGYRHSLTCNVS